MPAIFNALLIDNTQAIYIIPNIRINTYLYRDYSRARNIGMPTLI